MKLLLTSDGITNPTIARALAKLIQKPTEETIIGFVPTAMEIGVRDPAWFIEDFDELHRLGYTDIKIIDPAVAEVDWRSELDAVDVVIIGGGNTFRLLDEARKSGFLNWLNQHREDKVYVGISAGSILMTPTIGAATIDDADENAVGLTDLTALGWTSFELSPHGMSEGGNAAYAATISVPLYAIDDATAIQVINDEITVLSEGKWKIFNG